MKQSELRKVLAGSITYVTEPRAEAVPLRVPFLDLEPGQCRWPMEDGTFCGAPCEDPVIEGRASAYCKGHAQRAYRSREVIDDGV